MITITPKFLEPYFQGTKVHQMKATYEEKYLKFKQHADGKTPGKLITERRPSESEVQKAYRETIYVPKTKNPLSRVFNCLNKIRRSQDWSIEFDNKALAKLTTIPKGEDIETYTKEGIHKHQSLENWMFNVYLKNNLLDPCGVMAVIPHWFPTTQADANKLVQPVPMYFNSTDVIEFIDGEVAILKSKKKADIKDSNGRIIYNNMGGIYYVLTPQVYEKYEQIDDTLEFKLTASWNHNIGKLPAWQAGGQIIEEYETSTYYESDLDAMLASLDEAAREYSDLQIEVVSHIHSLLWIFSNQKCPTCKGQGKTPGSGNSAAKKCTDCNGTGDVPVSPFKNLIVSAAALGDKGLPTPPAGYVQKQTDIVKIQDERVRMHLNDALTAVNMQFLDQVPQNQSGKAKEVDKDELNNFVYTFAERLVANMQKQYWFMTEYRYPTAVPERERRELMRPKIAVPEKFDLLSAEYHLDEISKGKTGGLNPIIKSALEQDYAAKKFYNNPAVGDMYKLVASLDPFNCLSDDEKMTRYNNKAISQVDYVISSNINAFIKEAISENEKFPGLKFKEQYEELKKLADAKIAEITKSNKLTIAVNPAVAA